MKLDTSLNALFNKDPYDNNYQKEGTRLVMEGEWDTRMSVSREGKFVRSNQQVVEIFEGGEKTLFVEEVYTWQFQRNYNLLYCIVETHK